MRNYGQHNALLCGIRAAKYEVIVTMDDDLQHQPEDIPRLLTQLDEGFDVVYATPEREQHSFWRAIASRITRLALRSAGGPEVAKNVSAFRVFRTELRDAFARYEAPFRAAGFHPGYVTTSALAALNLVPDSGVTVFAKLSGHTLTVVVLDRALVGHRRSARRHPGRRSTNGSRCDGAKPTS